MLLAECLLYTDNMSVGKALVDVEDVLQSCAVKLYSAGMKNTLGAFPTSYNMSKNLLECV